MLGNARHPPSCPLEGRGGMRCVLSPSPRSHIRPVRSVCVSVIERDHRCPCPVRVKAHRPDVAHVISYYRTLSADLCFKDAPKDLMRKFVDTLTRLPNLKRLELLSVTHRAPVTAGLKRKCANFPNIREMIVSPKYPDFIRCCPNVENLTFRYGLSPRSRVAIDLCGPGLKRIVGVNFSMDFYVRCKFVKASPNLKQPLNGTVSQI